MENTLLPQNRHEVIVIITFVMQKKLITYQTVHLFVGARGGGGWVAILSFHKTVHNSTKKNVYVNE